jgi:hypothetical protein
VRIRIVDGGSPVVGTTVKLRANLTAVGSDDYDAAMSATTDEDGVARWSNLPGRPDGYLVSCLKPGEDFYRVAYLSELTPGFTGPFTERTIDISVWPPETPVDVTVVDEDGQPVADAVLDAYRANGDDPTWSGRDALPHTDAEGKATVLLNISRGPLNISATLGDGAVGESAELVAQIVNTRLMATIVVHPAAP